MDKVLVKRADNASYLKQKGYEIGEITKDEFEILNITNEEASRLLKEKDQNFNVDRNDYERDTRFLLYLKRKRIKNVESKIRNK